MSHYDDCQDQPEPNYGKNAAGAARPFAATDANRAAKTVRTDCSQLQAIIQRLEQINGRSQHDLGNLAERLEMHADRLFGCVAESANKGEADRMVEPTYCSGQFGDLQRAIDYLDAALLFGIGRAHNAAMRNVDLA